MGEYFGALVLGAFLVFVLGAIVGHYAGWGGGEQYGRQQERIATARAMDTLRKHYGVPVREEEPTHLFRMDDTTRITPEQRRCIDRLLEHNSGAGNESRHTVV
jgi:hypothetical protein